ncbi:MAG: patatin-like phospholipase family protein [Myxococcales bacterium]|nr:patatin-like phospholipase family protein [Myxococcales bacterium]
MNPLRVRAVSAALLAASAAGCPGIRPRFAELNYPRTMSTTPARRPLASVVFAARAVPLLVVGFDEPAKVAAFLRQQFLATDPTTATRVLAAAAEAIDQDNGWLDRQRNDLVAAAGLVQPNERSAALTPHDRARLALALEDAAQAFALLLLQNSQDSAPSASQLVRADCFTPPAGGWAELHADETKPSTLWRYTLDAAARLLEQQARSLAGEQVGARLQRPTLAMSGGSGNGAFTAGYLYALLYANAVAREREQAQPKPNVPAPRSERFGSVTGTSVGSLLAGLLEGWHAPAAAPAPTLTPRLVRSLSGDRATPEELVAVAHDDERRRVDAIQPSALSPWQRTTLNLIRSLIAGSWEGDVLCLRDGNVLQPIVGDGSWPIGAAMTSLLKFDPLEDTMVDFFRASTNFSRSNDLWRESMAVDLQFNITAALGEGTCASSQRREECEAKHVLASVSLPMFVPPVPSVITGLVAARSQDGMWFDGGLRSGTPSLRALELGGVRYDSHVAEGRGRVLAISTHRITGARHAPSANDTGFGILVATTGGPMTEEVREAEIAQTNLFAIGQRARFCAYAGRVDGPTPCDADANSNGAQAMQGALHGDVFAVFVPNSLDDRVVAGGYTFNPIVLTGLFYAGVQTFLAGYRRPAAAHPVLSHLGWAATSSYTVDDWALGRASKLQALDTRAARYLQELRRAMDDSTQWAASRDRSRTRVLQRMGTCR